MGGGLTDWHRQKRKKEQKKNKEKRIAERDARVLETKTVSSVQEEIRKLERQHKVKKDDDGNDIPLPHAVQSKLDRLKKEIKLLKEAEGEKNDNTSSTTTKNATAAALAAWKPLDNPQLSIYYDPVMNPFGEPPPGHPRLYHTADGRTTFNLSDAALPGSRPRPPPPPPPPAPRKGPPSQPRRPPPPNRPQQQQQQQQQRSISGKEEMPLAKQEPNQKRNKDQSTNTEKVLQEQEGTSKVRLATKTPTSKEHPRAPPKPRVAPDLPAPSNAVKRGRSRLKADIWASTEEIDYHQHTDDPQAHLTLEGVQVVGGKDEPIKEWWYEDQQKQIQGPFPHEQMIAWIQAGYFPSETRARPRPDAPWKPFHHYPVIRAVLNGSNGEVVAQKEEKEISVQDRIASLRKEHQKTSIADRIAALRGDGPKPEINECETDHDESGEKDDDALPSPSSPPEEEGAEEIPTYPVVDGAYDVVDDNVLPPPPPPPPPLEGGPTDEPAPYVIDETETEDDVLPPPPPPPPNGAEEDEVPAYAIGESSVYEETTENPLVYPTVDYSVDTTYPVEDTPVTDDYPVFDAYPTMDSPDTDVKPPVKKKIKVDREVISFLPTNLQKRKKKF